MIVKYTVLILALTKITLSYRQYKYHELCPTSKAKAFFDTIANNKPMVRLSDGVESAALVHYNSDQSTVKKMGSCEFTVKLDNPGDSNGFFASIKRLKLRENTYDSSCRDFLRFTYKNGSRTREICGNIDTTLDSNLIRHFFDVTSGEMKVEISIDSSYSNMDAHNGLEVYLVFTAYSNCYGDSTLRCSSRQCISEVFRDDEIINCPPPGCPDERKCVNNEKPHIVNIVNNKSSETPSGSTSIIVVSVLVIVAAAVLICCCKKKKTANDSRTPNGEHVEELRPTTRSDMDSYLEFQDVRAMPLVPPQQQQQHPQHYPMPMPHVPEQEPIRGPMPHQQYNPAVPTAPPVDYAPSGGYSDDPPPYDALFTSNQNKRANV